MASYYLSCHPQLPCGISKLKVAVGNWLFATGSIKPCATGRTAHNLLHKRELVAKGSLESATMCSDVGRYEPAVGLPSQPEDHVGPVCLVKLDRSFDVWSFKKSRRDLAVSIRTEQPAVHHNQVHAAPFQILD